MQPAIVNRIIDAITDGWSMKIQIYNPKTGTGLLRHVLIRYGKETDQVMVVFVTAERIFHPEKSGECSENRVSADYNDFAEH